MGAEDPDTRSGRGGWWPAARSFIAGSFSGAALVLAGHPFDTIVVRMSSGQAGTSSVLRCLQDAIRNEGLLSMYKGVVPPLLLTGSINAVLFGTQAMLVRAQLQPGQATATIPQTMLAAVGSGFVMSIGVAPMEGVKARLQVSTEAGADRRMIPNILRIYRSLGITRGLYRGWVPTALCRMTNWAYFGPYALVSQKLNPDGKKATIGTAVLAGSSAGVCYWSVVFPLAVIKNRIQAAPDQTPPRYSGMAAAAREIAQNGWRGFYVGFLPCIMRAVPANAACFVAFETIMNILPPYVIARRYHRLVGMN